MKFIEIDGIEYRFFDHLFAVSRCGKVLRKLEPYLPTPRPDGYLTLGRRGLMHRVVATCWIDNPDGSKHVHHKNEDKADNRADNLEWVTPKQHFAERHGDTHGRHSVSPEAREKMRQYRLGKVIPLETREKQRAALKGKPRPYFSRAPHSEESKAKRSLTHPKNMECKIAGVVYRSLAEAARVTGIHRFTIRKRCLSKNFPDYELLT